METFAAGDTIIREGERGDRMYLIFRGRVEVLKNPPESPEVFERLAVLEEGDAFGEMEIIDIQARSAGVRALEPTTLASLSHGDLYRLSRSRPAVFTFLVLNVAREISRRLRKMDALAAGFLFASETKSGRAAGSP
jgi:CRP-like cAMP-binding protein